jgi:hypothetical protein
MMHESFRGGIVDKMINDMVVLPIVEFLRFCFRGKIAFRFTQSPPILNKSCPCLRGASHKARDFPMLFAILSQYIKLERSLKTTLGNSESNHGYIQLFIKAIGDLINPLS